MTDYSKPDLSTLLYGENYIIYDFIETEKERQYYVDSKIHDCECPLCGHKSHKVKTVYNRKIQEVSQNSKKTMLFVRSRKYWCENPKCPLKSFAQRHPFARAYQRRSNALNELIIAIGISSSQEGASKYLKLAGMELSADSIKRLFEEIEIEEDKPEAIGIDDVAIRKGHTYATAVYAEEDHRLLKLINGRNSEAVEKYLKEYSEVKKVYRDRAGSYSKAIEQTHPDCIQIADRFHLIQNCIDYLTERLRKRLPKSLYIIQGESISETDPSKRTARKVDEAFLDSLNYDLKALNSNSRLNTILKEEIKDSKAKEKQDLIRSVRQYCDEQKRKPGRFILEKAAQHCGVSVSTLNKYLRMSEEEIQALSNPEEERTNWYNLVFKMLEDGHSDFVIFHYIERTYPEEKLSKYKLGKMIDKLSAKHFPERVRDGFNRFSIEDKKTPDVVRLARNKLLIYLFSKEENKSKKITQNIDLIFKQYPFLEEAQQAYCDFHDVIMGQNPDELDDFIREHIRDEDLLSDFVEKLKKDIAPIKNSISYSGSSGFVEGNNNKFKLAKRIVYGRSKLVNLEKKCKLFIRPVESISLKDLLPKNRVRGYVKKGQKALAV